MIFSVLLWRFFNFVVQSLSHVQVLAAQWTAAHQASLSFSISRSLLKLMYTELVMPTISSSAALFSSCPQSLPALGSFPVSQFFASGSQSIRALASALPMNIHGWFPLGLTSLIFQLWLSLYHWGLVTRPNIGPGVFRYTSIVKTGMEWLLGRELTWFSSHILPARCKISFSSSWVVIECHLPPIVLSQILFLRHIQRPIWAMKYNSSYFSLMFYLILLCFKTSAYPEPENILCFI